jgi:hypothetical protein
MGDAMAVCTWGRDWPSGSRTQGVKLASGKRAPEDEETRSARRAIQVCRVVGSPI